MSINQYMFQPKTSFNKEADHPPKTGVSVFLDTKAFRKETTFRRTRAMRMLDSLSLEPTSKHVPTRKPCLPPAGPGRLF